MRCYNCEKIVYDTLLDNETSKIASDAINKKRRIINDCEFSDYIGFTPLFIKK